MFRLLISCLVLFVLSCDETHTKTQEEMNFGGAQSDPGGGMNLEGGETVGGEVGDQEGGEETGETAPSSFGTDAAPLWKIRCPDGDPVRGI